MVHSKIAAAVLALTVVLAFALASRSFGAEPKASAEDGPTAIVMTVPLKKDPFFAGAVASIKADGALRIVPWKSETFHRNAANEPLTEGLWLGVVRASLKAMLDAHLVRVEVTKVGEDVVEARVAKGLNKKIELGKLILLVRPPEFTQAQMAALPDLVTMERGPKPIATPEGPDQAAQARAERSTRNLREIGKALVAFESSYRRLPPAALIGPDGKPWHSWRVLLFPILKDPEQAYIDYRFDEPWNSPHNEKLLDAMPPVYTDQPSVKPGEHFTRYAAATGPGMVFSADGVRFEGKPNKGSGIRMKQVVDGASNTLAIGTLPLAAKVPWLKPEDVVVGEQTVRLGDPGGFAAPYRSAGKNYALFAGLDGKVAGVFASIASNDLRGLLTIDDGQPADAQTVPGVFLPEIPVDPMEDESNSSVIYLFKERGVLKARLIPRPVN